MKKKMKGRSNAKYFVFFRPEVLNMALTREERPVQARGVAPFDR